MGCSLSLSLPMSLWPRLPQVTVSEPLSIHGFQTKAYSTHLPLLSLDTRRRGAIADRQEMRLGQSSSRLYF